MGDDEAEGALLSNPPAARSFRDFEEDDLLEIVDEMEETRAFDWWPVLVVENRSPPPPPFLPHRRC